MFSHPTRNSAQVNCEILSPKTIQKQEMQFNFNPIIDEEEEIEDVLIIQDDIMFEMESDADEEDEMF